jgi:hypothetical protein
LNSLDPQDKRGIFALFKGDSGSGKSVGALSFPTPHVSDYDKKMPMIAQKHFPGKSIDYDHYSNIFELSDWINKMKMDCPYETLVEDSLTALNSLILSSVAEVKNEKTIEMLSRQKGKALEMMSIDYYNGAVRFLQSYYFDELKKLWTRPGNPKHIIIIAHVMTKESSPDLRANQRVVTQSRSIVTAGKAISAYVPTVFDDMYHFATKDKDPFDDKSSLRHVCCTEAVGEDNAKTAYKLDSIIDFTNKSLYNELNKVIQWSDPFGGL